MICYSPPMPEPIVKQGIQLPDSVWKAFDERVTAIYGESNKGRKKWLYVVAIKLLMTLDDETIQQLAVASEVEWLGVKPDQDYADVAVAAARSLRRAASRAHRESADRR